MRIQIFRLLTVLCLQLPFTFAQEAATTKAADPDPLVTAESDYILKDFHFVNGVLGTMERRVRLSHWFSRGSADSALGLVFRATKYT